jgi:hypothetical protein
VVTPWLIIIPCSIAKGAENAFKIMLVLKSNVLLNNCDTSRLFVIRNRCACHIHLPSLRYLGETQATNTTSATSALACALVDGVADNLMFAPSAVEVADKWTPRS